MPTPTLTTGSAAHRNRPTTLSGSRPVSFRTESATARRPRSGIWAAFWGSRLLVWVTGCLAVLVLGAVPQNDPAGISTSFGSVGNLLFAPAVRWDAIGYLQIAQSGYVGARSTAYYPAYPLLIKVASWLTGSAALAGVLLSLAGLSVALWIVRRLTELELGRRAANITVDLIAFGPMAMFLSAVYTESLFLALSAGMFFAARRGRWAAAGVLGALAAGTRVTGVALLAPMLLLFFYGPRTDLAPMPVSSRWKPRYKLTPAVLWAALIPAGFAAFALYLRLRGFDASSMIQAQQHFLVHRFVFPAVTVWDGVKSAWHQLTLELHGVSPSLYQQQSLFQTVALALAVVALAGTLRRLPIAYGAYVAVGLVIALSTPTVGDPLRGLARYASVLFPLQMWAGAWASERGVQRTLVLCSAVLLVLFTVEFATWHVVGTPFV